MVTGILKLEIYFFSPPSTAVTFSPAFPNLPSNQILLGPCSNASTTLKGIKLCKEKSCSAEALPQENLTAKGICLTHQVPAVFP